MKKLFLIAALALATVSASAQWYVGGQVSFGQVKEDGVKTTEYSIAPEVGYTINETWAVGASLGYTHSDDDAIKVNHFSIAPYARYTYFSVDRVSLFVDGAVNVGFGKTEVNGQSGDTAITYGVGFKPGIAFKVTDNFSLVAHAGFLGYQGANDEAKSAGKPEKWGLDFDSSNLQFGFYFNF